MFSNSSVALETLPHLEDVQFSPLDDNATREHLLSTFVFLLPFSIGICLLLWLLSDVPKDIALLVTAITVIVNVSVFFFIVATVKKTGIALREHDLLLRKGVFWQKTIIVPFNRVQHIETHRNPFERKLTLASLKLFTAGGMGADLEINGLNVERASKIRQFILQKEQGTSHE